MEIYENMENYEELASAIVLLAVKDYGKALRRLNFQAKNPKWLKMLDKKKSVIEKNAGAVRDDCERFFRSDYFRALSNIDPELIIQKMGNDAKALSVLGPEINPEKKRGNMERYRAIVADYEAGMSLLTIADRQNYTTTSGVSLALKRAEKAGIAIIWRRPRHERKM